MRLAAWLATSRPDVCQACKKSNPRAVCRECPHSQPIILPENYPVWLLISQFGAYLFDGMGGVSAGGIRLAMESLGLPSSYYKSIGLFLAKYKKAQDEQQNHN